MKAENRRILNDPYGFSIPLMIENRIGGQQEIRGFYTDVAIDIDPENGLPIVAGKAAISMHIDDITIAEIDDNYEDWKVTWENAIGETKTGVFNNIMPDKTLGMLTVTVRVIE
jgi:hypothetical protein